jgi:hypothetical protein
MAALERFADSKSDIVTCPKSADIIANNLVHRTRKIDSRLGGARLVICNP